MVVKYKKSQKLDFQLLHRQPHTADFKLQKTDFRKQVLVQNISKQSQFFL